MSVKADIRTGFRGRYGIIALVLLGFMCWCLNDGFVKYPKQKMIYDTYMSIQFPDGKDRPANENWVAEWQAKVAEFNAQGMNVAETRPDERTQNDIYTQFIMAGISGFLGFAAGLYFLAIGGNFVEADEQGIATKKVAKVPWSAIKNIDIARWESKGIAVLSFEDNGRSGYITLDDWKFDRDETVSIYKLAKQNTGLITDEAEEDNDEEMDEIA